MYRLCPDVLDAPIRARLDLPADVLAGLDLRGLADAVLAGWEDCGEAAAFAKQGFLRRRDGVWAALVVPEVGARSSRGYDAVGPWAEMTPEERQEHLRSATALVWAETSDQMVEKIVTSTTWRTPTDLAAALIDLVTVHAEDGEALRSLIALGGFGECGPKVAVARKSREAAAGG